MSTQKNLFSKARAILRKNVEFISNLNLNLNLKKNIGGEKIFKYGSDNYRNLKEKMPVFGKNGAPLEFKIGDKTFFRLYKPNFSEGYKPKKGYENLFIHPEDEKHFSSGKQKLFTRKGRSMKRGGSSEIALAVLSMLGALGSIVVGPSSGNDK